LQRSNDTSKHSIIVDLTTTMEAVMPLNLPDKELRAAIKAGAVAAECIDPVHAAAIATQAFADGEFSSAEQIDSWFDLQRIKQPALWGGAGSVPDYSEHAELLTAAFVNKSPDARAKLIAAIGHDAASAAAKAWQLSGLTDFSKPGVRPNGVATKVKGEQNPWARNYKGPDRMKAIASFIASHSIDDTHRMADSAGTVVSRPLGI
jgi:hypothetical protein